MFKAILLLRNWCFIIINIIIILWKIGIVWIIKIRNYGFNVNRNFVYVSFFQKVEVKSALSVLIYRKIDGDKCWVSSIRLEIVCSIFWNRDRLCITKCSNFHILNGCAHFFTFSLSFWNQISSEEIEFNYFFLYCSKC